LANPQRENGHIDLANEIGDALSGIRLSGEESQCLWVILRKTYGWHKKEDKISLSQFSVMTGLKRPAVSRALKKLLSKMIIVIIKNDNSMINIYRFNKDFDTWKPLSKKITALSKKIIPVIKNDNGVLSKMIHTKETLTKETIQKKKDIDIFSTHLLSVLKMPLSDKGKTEELLKELGLESMTAAVNRMKVYFDTVKQNKWTEYIIGKHWRNLYEKIQYFTSDENLEKKIIETMKANTKIDKPDCRTVSTDFSSDEKIMLEQREKKNG
jgi:phage replication O-like protein O